MGSIQGKQPAPPVRREPNDFIRAGAQAYNRMIGLPPISEGHYVRLNEALARRIADAAEAMPVFDWHNPTVRQAYAAFETETKQQWLFATNELGIRFEPWERPGQPYADSQQMTDDVRYKRHLYFFLGGEKHPYLCVPDPSIGFNGNEQFRAVHDLMAHAAGGYGFGPRGEENAWLAHSMMYSPLAQLAMTTETRAQNCWFNFGKHNYDAAGNPLNIPPAERPYPKQKAALLPVEFCDWRSVLHPIQSAA